MDLTKLTTVTKTRSGKSSNEDFDLRYLGDSKFRVSNAFYFANNMNARGFTLHTHEDGSLVLSNPLNEDAFAFPSKTSQNFQYGPLEEALVASGMVTRNEAADITLNKAAEQNGVTYFYVTIAGSEESEDTAEIGTEEEGTDLVGQAVTEDESAESIGTLNDFGEEAEATEEPEPAFAEEDPFDGI